MAGLFILGCSTSENTMSFPDDTVKKHLESFSEQNIDKICAHWFDEEKCIAYFDPILEMLGVFSFETDNLETFIASQNDSTCKINVGYSLKVTVSDTNAEFDVYESIELMKVEDEWIIDEIVDLESAIEHLKILIERKELVLDVLEQESSGMDEFLGSIKTELEEEIKALSTQINNCYESVDSDSVK